MSKVLYYPKWNTNIRRRIDKMKTLETINTVCSDLGTTKADLAKRMGILPSSLYRKLARESMTFEEFQKCLDVLGVTIEFNIKYQDGSVRSSQTNHEILLERLEMLEKEIEATKRVANFHKKSLRDLRTELNNAVGYAELGMRHGGQAVKYLEKLQLVLTNMDSTIAYSLGESVDEEQTCEALDNVEQLIGRRVLLVEDNKLNREIMMEVLVDHGLVVEEAENGREAVDAVKLKDAGYFDFVLMDVEMPVMDGYEATMRIRKLPNRIRANIPIMALTANSSPENREKAREVGMDDFLVKPINFNRMLNCLIKFQ